MTKIKIEFFKYTGKWYDSFEFESKFNAYEIQEIIKEAKTKKEFIHSMDFTIEVYQEGKGWNKYLLFSKK